MKLRPVSLQLWCCAVVSHAVVSHAYWPQAMLLPCCTRSAQGRGHVPPHPALQPFPGMAGTASCPGSLAITASAAAVIPLAPTCPTTRPTTCPTTCPTTRPTTRPTALPLQGKSPGEMEKDATIDIFNTGALKQGNVTVICFTRNLTQTGKAGVSLQQAYAAAAAAYSGRRRTLASDSTTSSRRRLAAASSSLPIILASGTNPYPDQHPSDAEHRYSVSMDFAAGDLRKAAPEGRTAQLIIIHGAVMLAVWVVVLPAGARCLRPGWGGAVRLAWLDGRSAGSRGLCCRRPCV